VQSTAELDEEQSSRDVVDRLKIPGSAVLLKNKKLILTSVSVADAT
jgi:hypothetical protein